MLMKVCSFCHWPSDKATLEEVLQTSNFMSLDRKMNRSLVLLMVSAAVREERVEGYKQAGGCSSKCSVASRCSCTTCC